MKGKILVIIFICTTAVVLLFILSREKTRLVGPNFSELKSQISQQASPAPPQAPKSFQFDYSTDLKEELDKVNPEVLDSDFE